MKNKILFSLLGLIFLIGFLSVNVDASFGVASSYWVDNGDTPGNPAGLYPGEDRLISVRLQNTESEDINVKVILKDGAGIASVQERSYVVPAETYDTEVPISLSIPEYAEIGTKYMVVVSFESIAPATEGGIAFGLGYDTKIPVEVVEQPVQMAPPLDVGKMALYIASVVLVVLIVLLFVLKKKKPGKKKK